MFLGEAIKGRVEMRPPAIKAAMRFWWRALHAHLCLAKLKSAESEIFGGGGENAKSSCIEFLDFSTDIGEERKPKLPHRPTENVMAISNSLKQNEKFWFTLRIVDENIFSYDQLKSLVIISSTLGNLGNRARRGMGGWKILSIDNDGFSFRFSDLINEINLFSQNYIFENNIIRLIADANLQTTKYPYIQSITKSESGFSDAGVFVSKLMKMSSKYKVEAPTKYAEIIGDHKVRHSSPVYVSLLKSDNYVPVVTKLNNPQLINGDKEFMDTYIQNIIDLTEQT